ncbi:MAG: C-GCAxxG-C-C family protein [Desulfohalobiaceae bacterium]
MKTNVSRRNFFVKAGAFALGIATGSTFRPEGADARQEMPPAPWPYAELDVERVRKLGHLGYYERACSEGAFWALISSLAEEVGYPYTHVPTRIMAFGSGGVAGWSTLCGAVNGSCAAMSLIAEDAKPLCDELLKWHVQTPFPMDQSNSYAQNHEFLVKKYKTDQALQQVTPTSPLCHVTVTRWCKESGYASGDSERSERCARMTGDVAAHAAQLLNALHADAFRSEYSYIGNTKTCRSCHAKGKPFKTGGWTRGKMDCESCHGDRAKIVDMEHCEQR